jgi:hypothetical protein
MLNWRPSQPVRGGIWRSAAGRRRGAWQDIDAACEQAVQIPVVCPVASQVRLYNQVYQNTDLYPRSNPPLSAGVRAAQP